MKSLGSQPLLDGREECGQTMSPGSDFSELRFLCIVSVVRQPPLWGGKVAVTALLSHLLGLSLQVQWERKYASYLVDLAEVFIMSHWLSLDHPTILDQSLASGCIML